MVDTWGRGGARLGLVLVAALGLLLGLTAARPEPLKPPTPEVVGQGAIGDMACGPCAIWNMVTCGSKHVQACGAALPGDTPERRVRALIEKYGSKPSTTYPDKRNRYTAKHGIAAEDLPGLVNDFLADHSTVRVAGQYLDRKKDEAPEKYLRRVHDLLRKSLAEGVPPIIDLRSFVARPVGWDYKWQGLMGHFVVVVEVDPVAPKGDKGFRFRFADSYTGQIETGYAHVEEARNFSATRAFSITPDGVEQWEWITDYPYLLVTAPSLRLLTQTEPWHARTIIALRHATVVKPSVPAGK